MNALIDKLKSLNISVLIYEKGIGHVACLTYPAEQARLFRNITVYQDTKQKALLRAVTYLPGYLKAQL